MARPSPRQTGTATEPVAFEDDADAALEQRFAELVRRYWAPSGREPTDAGELP